MSNQQLLDSIAFFKESVGLVSPVCGSSLEICNEETEVWLKDKEGNTFTIRSLVPDFAPVADSDHGQNAETLESFNFQYGKHEWIYDYDCRRVERILNDVMKITPEDVRGKSVLIVGCGSGAEVEVFRRFGAAQVLGIDLSTSVHEAQLRQIPHGNTLILRADALQPPLLGGSFDLVYCDGVLPHTQKPLQVLKKMLWLKKAGGIMYVRTLGVAVGLKSKGVFYLRQFLRVVTKRMSSSTLWSLSYLFALISRVPVLGKLSMKLFVFYDADELDLEITRLTNFRMYGDHTFRHHLSVDQITGAVKESNDQVQVIYRDTVYIIQ